MRGDDDRGEFRHPHDPELHVAAKGVFEGRLGVFVGPRIIFVLEVDFRQGEYRVVLLRGVLNVGDRREGVIFFRQPVVAVRPVVAAQGVGDHGIIGGSGRYLRELVQQPLFGLLPGFGRIGRDSEMPPERIPVNRPVVRRPAGAGEDPVAVVEEDVGPVIEFEKAGRQLPADRVEQLPGLDAGAAGRIESREPDCGGGAALPVAEPAGEFQIAFSVADGGVEPVFVENFAETVVDRVLLFRGQSGHTQHPPESVDALLLLFVEKPLVPDHIVQFSFERGGVVPAAGGQHGHAGQQQASEQEYGLPQFHGPVTWLSG